MTPWIRVAYQHDPADLSPVWLAVSRTEPSDGWQAAFRDTLADGTRVVQVRGTVGRGERVWLFDGDGPRRVREVVR